MRKGMFMKRRFLTLLVLCIFFLVTASACLHVPPGQFKKPFKQMKKH